MANVRKTHGQGFYKGFLAFGENFPREAAGVKEKGRNAFELRTLFPKMKSSAATVLTSPMFLIMFSITCFFIFLFTEKIMQISSYLSTYS